MEKYKMRELQHEAAQKGDAAQFASNQLEDKLEENAKLQKEVDSLNKKVKDLQKELDIEHMKHERSTDSHRKSISTLHTNMFKKLLDAEDEFEDKVECALHFVCFAFLDPCTLWLCQIEKLNETVKDKSRQLQIEKMKNEQSDKLRRDSVQTVHQNMVKKMLDIQAQHKDEMQRYENLENELKETKAQLRMEILKNAAKADKEAERRGQPQPQPLDGDDGNESDVSDLEDDQPKQKQPFDDLWDEADEPEAEV